jgi:hypothetical protein
MKKSKRRCRNCKNWFTPDPRNRFHQKFCSEAACQKVSKAASQKRWHSKPVNRYQWRGPDEVKRVREWREEHAGYWRYHRRKKRVRYKRT